MMMMMMVYTGTHTPPKGDACGLGRRGTTRDQQKTPPQVTGAVKPKGKSKIWQGHTHMQ
jgi:hypothetical protein